MIQKKQKQMMETSMTVSAHQSPIMYKITSPETGKGKRDRSVSRTAQRRGRKVNAFTVESKSRSKSQYGRKNKEVDLEDTLNKSALTINNCEDILDNPESAVSQYSLILAI